jgi:hypothetical protein
VVKETATIKDHVFDFFCQGTLRYRLSNHFGIGPIRRHFIFSTQPGFGGGSGNQSTAGIVIHYLGINVFAGKMDR